MSAGSLACIFLTAIGLWIFVCSCDVVALLAKRAWYSEEKACNFSGLPAVSRISRRAATRPGYSKPTPDGLP